jgi:hypothetical protein
MLFILFSIKLMEKRKIQAKLKVCSGRDCKRKKCVGCYNFKQTVSEVKMELAKKGPTIRKKDHFTELLTVTTGMSLAVFFPYIGLQ